MKVMQVGFKSATLSYALTEFSARSDSYKCSYDALNNHLIARMYSRQPS